MIDTMDNHTSRPLSSQCVSSSSRFLFTETQPESSPSERCSLYLWNGGCPSFSGGCQVNRMLLHLACLQRRFCGALGAVPSPRMTRFMARVNCCLCRALLICKEGSVRCAHRNKHARMSNTNALPSQKGGNEKLTPRSFLNDSPPSFTNKGKSSTCSHNTVNHCKGTKNIT